MSLVERYAANFIPNHVTFRERSTFRGLLIRKISLILCMFDCVCVCFVRDNKVQDYKEHFQRILLFYHRKGKNDVQARKECYAKSMEKQCINDRPV